MSVYSFSNECVTNIRNEQCDLPSRMLLRFTPEPTVMFCRMNACSAINSSVKRALFNDMSECIRVKSLSSVSTVAEPLLNTAL